MTGGAGRGDPGSRGESPAGIVARALATAAVRTGAIDALAILGGDDAARARRIVAAGGIDRADDPAFVAARPPGWRAIDPSWIDHALAGEDATVRAIVTGDRDDPTARWLARWFLGGFVPMPAPGPAAALDELPRLSAAAIVRAVDTIGRRQLVHAIAGASRAEHVALASRLPWGRALDGELAAIRSLGDAAAVARFGSRRAAAARTAGLAWSEALAPVQAGLRALAPLVHDRGDLAAQLAQRLPRELGLLARAILHGPFANGGADTVAEDEVARVVVLASR